MGNDGMGEWGNWSETLTVAPGLSWSYGILFPVHDTSTVPPVERDHMTVT